MQTQSCAPHTQHRPVRARRAAGLVAGGVLLLTATKVERPRATEPPFPSPSAPLSSASMQSSDWRRRTHPRAARPRQPPSWGCQLAAHRSSLAEAHVPLSGLRGRIVTADADLPRAATASEEAPALPAARYAPRPRNLPSSTPELRLARYTDQPFLSPLSQNSHKTQRYLTSNERNPGATLPSLPYPCNPTIVGQTEHPSETRFVTSRESHQRGRGITRLRTSAGRRSRPAGHI